jgi:hypothetical protein
MLLTKHEQQQIARQISTLIDLPLIPDKIELIIYEHAVAVIDQAVQEVLPDIFGMFMRDPAQGISPPHAVEFSRRVVEAVNQKINLPYFNEAQEAELMRLVIAPLITAMIKGRQLQAEELTGQAIPPHVSRALAYQTQITALVKAAPSDEARLRIQGLADEVGKWVKAIEDLAWRVDHFRHNPLIHQDLEGVPQAITDLESRLAEATDPAIRADIERTLATRKDQLAALEHLQQIISRAELRIESSLSSLGTIYSHLLTGQSTDKVADYGNLPAELEEETRVLREHLEALEEVKLGESDADKIDKNESDYQDREKFVPARSVGYDQA